MQSLLDFLKERHTFIVNIFLNFSRCEKIHFNQFSRILYTIVFNLFYNNSRLKPYKPHTVHKAKLYIRQNLLYKIVTHFFDNRKKKCGNKNSKLEFRWFLEVILFHVTSFCYVYVLWMIFKFAIKRYDRRLHVSNDGVSLWVFNLCFFKPGWA